KIADGVAVEGMEAFAPALTDNMEPLLTHLPEHALIVGCDPERIRTRAVELEATSAALLDASWINAASAGEAPSGLGESAYMSIAELRSIAAEAGLPWWGLTPFTSADESATEEDDAVVVGAAAADSYRG